MDIYHINQVVKVLATLRKLKNLTPQDTKKSLPHAKSIYSTFQVEPLMTL